jgi:formate hydrogenlyase subunit 6/NADH:ubiquinone oxidoreductase subunit I
LPSRIDTLREVLAHYSSPLTLNYPSNVVADRKYSQIPEGLRGLLERDKDKCIACRACANVCSGKATTYYDNLEQATRTISVFHLRCTFCQHCQIECPTEAITLTKKFELATGSRNDPPPSHLLTSARPVSARIQLFPVNSPRAARPAPARRHRR